MYANREKPNQTRKHHRYFSDCYISLVGISPIWIGNREEEKPNHTTQKIEKKHNQNQTKPKPPKKQRYPRAMFCDSIPSANISKDMKGKISQKC